MSLSSCPPETLDRNSYVTKILLTFRSEPLTKEVNRRQPTAARSSCLKKGLDKEPNQPCKLRVANQSTRKLYRLFIRKLLKSTYSRSRIPVLGSTKFIRAGACYYGSS